MYFFSSIILAQFSLYVHKGGLKPIHFISSIIYCQNLFLGACYKSAEIVLTVSERVRLYPSESDVYRRQILTYKEDPRTERF